MVDFSETQLIGRVGESLFENTVKKKHIVYRFGYESSVRALEGTDNKYAYTPETNMIRAMPDFVVYNPENQMVVFLEVKTTQTTFSVPERYARARACYDSSHYAFSNAVKFFPGVIFCDIHWTGSAAIKFYSAKLKIVVDEKGNPHDDLDFDELSFDKLPFKFSQDDADGMAIIIKKFQFINAEQFMILLRKEKELERLVAASKRSIQEDK